MRFSDAVFSFVFGAWGRGCVPEEFWVSGFCQGFGLSVWVGGVLGFTFSG